MFEREVGARESLSLSLSLSPSLSTHTTHTHTHTTRRYKLPPSNSTKTSSTSHLERWPLKLNDALIPEAFKSPIRAKKRMSKKITTVSSFIFRTAEERSICAFQGSWDLDQFADKSRTESQIKRRFDLLLVDIHGTWALTIPSRVSSSRMKLPSLRHQSLQEVISFLTKADVCQIDQTLFRAYFEACVRSGTWHTCLNVWQDTFFFLFLL